MHAYCASKGIPVLPVGKLVVAVEEVELPRLHELYDQAVRNGVPGVVPEATSSLTLIAYSKSARSCCWKRGVGSLGRLSGTRVCAHTPALPNPFRVQSPLTVWVWNVWCPWHAPHRCAAAYQGGDPCCGAQLRGSCSRALPLHLHRGLLPGDGSPCCGRHLSARQRPAAAARGRCPGCPGHRGWWRTWGTRGVQGPSLLLSLVPVCSVWVPVVCKPCYSAVQET